ncbi:MAG: glycosyltransferase [Bacteroidales bacterium]|nr:glycosyltransferase [Bacteroidales bacterium]
MTDSAKTFQYIAMLSTHGYFDPVPQLGRTDTGGQVVYVLELAKALSLQGVKVDIYTRWFEPEKRQVDPVPGHPGVRVIRIPAGGWEFISKESIYPVLPELAFNMMEFIGKNGLNYDLFHGHYVDAGIVSLEVASALSKPVFFTAHSLGAWKRDQMGGNAAEMEEKYNFSHRINEEMRIFRSVNGQTLTSKVQLGKMKKLYPFDAPNIGIIPPGVDIHRFRPLKEGEQETCDLPSPYIFNLSRIDENKGHDLLLEAFALFRKEHAGVHLVIGGGSPRPKAIEEKVFHNIHRIIESRHLKNSVHVIGYVPDEKLVTYYRQGIFFVLPSLFEPLGMTAQEAMACGQAVVASKFGGISNVITHRKDGFLVNASDPDEFAGVMSHLIKEPLSRQQAGQNAARLAREEYSWEAIAGKFLDFYSKFA